MRTCPWGALFFLFSFLLPTRFLLPISFLRSIFSNPSYLLPILHFIFLSSSVMGDRISSSIQDLCPPPVLFCHSNLHSQTRFAGQIGYVLTRLKI